jgi:hypothetical protein
MLVHECITLLCTSMVMISIVMRIQLVITMLVHERITLLCTSYVPAW